MQILSAVRHGDAGKAQQLNEGLKPLWDLFIEYSSLRVVYAAGKPIGYLPRRPARPILPLPEAAQQQVRRTLAALALT